MVIPAAHRLCASNHAGDSVEGNQWDLAIKVSSVSLSSSNLLNGQLADTHHSPHMSLGLCTAQEFIKSAHCALLSKMVTERDIGRV